MIRYSKQGCEWMLSGVKVLDLSRVFPGHYASLILADLGAEVIKIEDAGREDFLRSFPGSGDGGQTFFQAVNRNKKSLRLDLKQAAGRDIFLKMAAKSQVIIENFRPGTVDRLGIGYDAVQKCNPSIVYCAISGFGQKGPYISRPGHDLNFIGLSGILFGTSDGTKPVMPGLSLAAFSGGMYGALGILAALFQQRQTGQGSYIDASILDGMLAMMEITAAKGSRGVITQPICNQPYRTKDNRWITLAALEEKFWQRFCRRVNREDLLPFHRSDACPDNPAFQEMTVLFQNKTLAQWMEILEDADCCFAPVLPVSEALAGDHAAARGLGNAFPVKFSSYQPSSHPAPTWGEQTEEVLREFGFPRDAVEKFREAGIID